jgi:hypothetical protein
MTESETLDHFSGPPLGKKKARPTDGGRRSRPRVGGGLLRGVLVEPPYAAHTERPLRGGQAPSPHPAVAKDDPSVAKKAISGYGLYLPEIDETWISGSWTEGPFLR